METIDNIHNNAAGFSIKSNNISKLYDYANKKLENINFNEGFYEADFVTDANASYLEEMILDLWQGRNIYGQACPEPLIIIKNLTIKPQNCQIMGTNKDTIKITFGKISYLKFKAKDLIEQISQFPNGCSATIVGRGNVNTWMNRQQAQIFIDDIEVNPIDNTLF